MEVIQFGMTWNMMIQKRKVLRSCFNAFDFDIVTVYGQWHPVIKVVALFTDPLSPEEPRFPTHTLL